MLLDSFPKCRYRTLLLFISRYCPGGPFQDATASPQFDLAVAVEPFSPRKVFTALKAPFPVATADRDALSRVGLWSKIQGSPEQVKLTDGALDLDESKLVFSATAKDFAKPDLTFDLTLDKLNLDRYLPPSSEKSGEVKKDQTAAPKKTDYLPLRTLVVDGKARVGTLTAKGMKMQDINITVSGRNGVIQIDPGWEAPELETREVFGVSFEQRRNAVIPGVAVEAFNIETGVTVSASTNALSC